MRWNVIFSYKILLSRGPDGGLGYEWIYRPLLSREFSAVRLCLAQVVVVEEVKGTGGIVNIAFREAAESICEGLRFLCARKRAKWDLVEKIH